MDSQNQSSSSTNLGPQIRSRITVVCAECKRLKLRCDRRTPCGSCTKRDTVVRCIYSPAAAEKVDLHSLNNRLIQVESTLALITSGQTPPAFQPTYPFSLPQAATSTSTFHPNSSAAAGGFQHQQYHQHHHHNAAPPSSSQFTHESLMLSEQDVKMIWLDDLSLNLSANLGTEKGKQRERSVHLYHPHNSGSDVKLEPSPVDIDFQRDHQNTHLSLNNATVIDHGRQGAMDFSGLPDRLSPNLFPEKRSYSTVSPHPPDTTPLPSIPPLSIYYPVPTIPLPESTSISRAASPLRPPLPTSPSTSNGMYHLPPPAAPPPPNMQYPNPQAAGPQITPALLALLPSVERCQVLLGKAREVFRVRPVPFIPPSFFTGASSAFPASLASLASVSSGGRSGRHKTEPVKGGRTGFEAPEGEDDHADQNDNGTDEEMDGAWRIFERRCWIVLGVPFVSGSAAPGAGRGRNGYKAREDTKKGKDKEGRRLKEDKEREKERAKRAREIYFAGMGGLGQSATAPHRSATPPTREGSRRDQSAIVNPTSSGPSDDTSGPMRSNESDSKHEESLAFFALMCAVLAVGASATARDATSTLSNATNTESSGFLHALSQQAMGVWDTHTSSSVSMTMTKEMAELERIDHLLACLVGVACLLFASGDSIRDFGAMEGGDRGDATKARQEKEKERVSSIVGKLVNAARNLRLGQNPSRPRGASARASSKTKDENEKEDSLEVGSAKMAGRRRYDEVGSDEQHGKQRDEEEWRRTVWWDVLFYDLFIASALGQPPYLPPYVYSSRPLPSLGAAPVPTSTAAIKIQAHPQDGFEATGDGEAKAQNFSMNIAVDINEDSEMRLDDPYIGDAFLAQSSRSLSPNEQVTRGHSRRSERQYLSARCRLTHLAQRILHALANPACCCGYTLDQAFSLERELRSWCASLPPYLRSFSAETDPHGIGQKDRRDVAAVHASELALLANMLTMKLWSPFLRTGDGVTPTSINPHAAQASLQAACGILKAARMLVPVSPVREMAPPAMMETIANAMPTSLAFLPLPKVVWDSVVVCARASIGASSSDSNALFAFDTISALGKQAHLEALRTGLDLLAKLAALEGNKTIGKLKESEKQMAESLYRRFVLGVTVPINQNAGTQAEDMNGDLERGRKRKHDEVDFGFAAYPTGSETGPEPLLTNGSIGGSSGDGAFDFTGLDNPQHHPHPRQTQHRPQTGNNPGQYLHDPIPLDPLQQPAEGSTNSGYESVPLEHPKSASSSHPPSASPMPPPPVSSSQQQRNEGQDKPDLAAAVFAVAAARRDERDRERTRQKKDKTEGVVEKEKAQTKKSNPYPSVGIRVRVGKDGMPLVKSRTSQSNRGSSSSSPNVSGKTPGPLMTSTPRPLPSSSATADRVLAYQQQQKQRMIGVGNSTTGPAGDMTTDGYRSRSSSLSMGLGPTQLHPQHSTQQQQQPGLGLSNYGLTNTDTQQEHEQSHTYHPVPHMLEQVQQQNQHDMYDPPNQSTSFNLGPTPSTDYSMDQLSHNPDASHGSFSHSPSTKASGPFSGHPSNTVASPLHSASPAASPFPHTSTHHMSDSNSPFGSMSAASVMPTFGNSTASHHVHPTPHIFGRPRGNSLANPSGSPTTYFHSPRSFAEGAFADSPGSTQNLSGHHTHGIGMLEDANVDTMDQNLMTQTGVYEKTPQTTFDNPHQRMIEPQSHLQPAIQHQHLQPVSGYDSRQDHDFNTQQQHLAAMSMDNSSAVGSLWPPQSHSSHHASQTYPYWNT